MALDRSSIKFMPAQEAGFAVGRQELVKSRMYLLHQTLANVRHAIPTFEEHSTQAVEAATVQAMKLVEQAALPEEPQFPVSAAENALDAARKAVADAQQEAA
jgi:hypothetical protein